MQGQMIFPDSIYALSSGRLPAGVAVVRVSGRHTRAAVTALTGSVPRPRFMRLGPIFDAAGQILDRGLTVFFPGPASYTGEDSCEFHLHGGRAVVGAVLAALEVLEGLRHAEPGEFSRRAFLNGKVDLTGVEAISDLVSAETEAQRRFALANASGAQQDLYSRWRQIIVHARAMIEAELDFSDQEDVPGSISAQIWKDIGALIGEIESHLASYRRAEIIRDGYTVVILGAPNAGKSSLLNALARREVAIVTDEPGTTRDLVEVALDLEGIKVTVVDTAGIRETQGKVEAIGIAKALAAAERADLVLRLRDLSEDEVDTLPASEVPVVDVGNKLDLLSGGAPVGLRPQFPISTLTGEGISALVDELQSRAKAAAGDMGDVMPSRQRHIALLGECLAALEHASREDGRALELRAEDLRSAGNSLGRIAGTVDVEDMLDTIFSKFCIGK